MSRRKDWATDEARRAYDLIQQGISRDVAVNYLSGILRTAAARGAIEASKPNGAKPAKAEAKGLV